MPQPWGRLMRRDHVLVMGMPGCGKTPFAAELVAEARRAVFCCPTGDWHREGEVVTAAELVEYPELLRGPFVRLVVDVDRDRPGDDFKVVVAACRAAAAEGGLVILADEVGDIRRSAEEELLSLHRNGHHDGIASVLCSPCANDFPKRCRDTASRVFSFYQKNADDVGTLDREYGDDFGTRARAWRHPAPPVEWTNPVLHNHTQHHTRSEAC
jgi:hypothetical protein